MRNQLHELLQEDQEPFHLQDYIHDRRQRLQPCRPKPNSATLINRRPRSIFTTKLCKNACFFSGGDSPDVIESPGISKSPQNVIFLHVPARTAAMLLEASIRIRKPKKLDAKRLGVFGSFLKKLKQSSSADGKKSEEEVGVLLKDILKYDSSTAFVGRSVKFRQNPTFSPEIPDGRSDQNLDFETEFCSSPFRFVLHNDSFNYQTPNSSSSASSAETEEGEKCRENDFVEQCENKEEEQEEHCSPVTVLDPDPYEEENDNEERHEEVHDETISIDMDCSYADVQRTHERLLEKLSRFERLAKLDPLELEIRLQEDYDDGFDLSEEEGNCKENESSSNERALSYIDLLVKEALNRPEFGETRVPTELKKVTKLILTEEKLKLDAFDDKSSLLERVFQRLASWKEVASDIINTMAGNYITGDLDEWARKQDQVTDTAMDIELAIFESLIQELCKELTPL